MKGLLRMTIRYVQPQLWKGAVLTDTDRVFASILVPPGGTFQGVDIELHCHGVETTINKALLVGIDAYAIPMEDLDGALNYDQLWDKLVTKTSEDVDTLDLDTASTDTDPDFEPGELDWNEVYQFGEAPERLYKFRKLFTAANYIGSLGATGGFTHFLPGMVKNIKVRSGGTAKVTTAIMFALSSPVLDRTTTTATAPGTEVEMLQLQLLKRTAEMAIYQLIGLTEAGAETPYLDAAEFIDKTLAPDIFEESSSDFVTTTWNVTAKSTFRMSVPGELSVGTLSGE